MDSTKKKKYAGVFLLYLLVFTTGFTYSVTGSVLPDISELFNLTKTQVSSLPRQDLGNRLSLAAVGRIFTSSGSLMTVVLFMNMCYGGAESILTTWMPKYFSDTFPVYSEFRLRVTLSLFWFSMTAGRQICAVILKRGTEPQILLALMSVAAAACLVIAPLLRNGISAEIMFISTGLFLSGMFPTIVSFADHFSDRFSSTMFILIMALGTLGATIMSKPVGFIADRIGFNFVIMISVLPLVCILFLALIITHLRHQAAR